MNFTREDIKDWVAFLNMHLSSHMQMEVRTEIRDNTRQDGTIVVYCNALVFGDIPFGYACRVPRNLFPIDDTPESWMKLWRIMAARIEGEFRRAIRGGPSIERQRIVEKQLANVLAKIRSAETLWHDKNLWIEELEQRIYTLEQRKSWIVRVWRWLHD